MVSPEELQQLATILSQKSNTQTKPEAPPVHSKVKRRVRPVTDWCKHYALIFDETGYPVKCKKLKYKDDTFDFKERSYNFLPEQASFFKLRFWFSSRKFYFYNLNNPNPILLDEKNSPILDSKPYYRFLHTDLIKKLNDALKESLLDKLLQPKVLIPLAILLVIVVYYFSGGKIT